MKKVLDFLEKNVQWVAMGLGGLYLLWMVWAYVINSPVKVTGVAPGPLSPGDVDQYIADHVGNDLRVAMDGNPNVTFSTPKFSNMLAGVTNPKPMPDLSVLAYNSPTGPAVSFGPDDLPGRRPPGAGPITPVVQLPKLPAVTNLKEIDGRTNVFIQPAIAPGATAPPPPQPPAPGQPANGTDIAWATVMFHIPVSDIAKEFVACKIPVQFMTSMLRVELVRQERQSSGDWGPEEVVPALTTQLLQPWPSGAKKNDYRNYANWAATNWPAIMQPQFYLFLRGDQWHLPGEPVPGPQQPVDPNAKPLEDTMIRPGFNPEHPPTDMTTAERQALQKYKAQKQKEKADQIKANRPQRPPTGRGPLEGGGGPPRGPGGFAPNDPGRPPGVRPPPGRRGPLDGGDGLPPEMGGMEGQMPMGPQSNPAVQGVFPLPQGEFDPRAWVDPKNPQPGTGELVGWAHDATAQPGKTYRYKVRYKMKNPIWGTANVAKPPTLAQEFALVSPDSAWTNEVKIPALTSFFVATVNPGGQSARVDVYRWQLGETHPATFTVSPGDSVGGTSKGIDFSTGYTVVDLRPDSRSGDYYVLLIDSSGRMDTRDPKEDQKKPELQRMKQQVTAAPAAPGAGAVAGAPPGGH